jgi:hypothetical protein
MTLELREGATMDAKDLLEQLLDFDRSRVKKDDCLVSWKAIAGEVGVSEDTLQRWCLAHDLELPRWGPPGKLSPVFIPRAKVHVLKKVLFG